MNMNWLALGSATLVGSGAAIYLAPYGLRLWQQRMLHNRCQQSRSLVLTYDDGPSRDLTPLLLDLLAAFQAKATFFLLGHNAAAYPQIVERIVAEGHEVGCHSENHRHPWKTWPWKVVQDLEQGYRTLEPWVEPNGLFRPPYGKLILPAWFEVWRRRAGLAWWTIDSGDTFTPLAKPERTLESVRHSQGGVVLLHDNERSAEHHQFVLQTTQHLLELARFEKLSIRRLGELLAPHQRAVFPGTAQ